MEHPDRQAVTAQVEAAVAEAGGALISLFCTQADQAVALGYLGKVLLGQAVSPVSAGKTEAAAQGVAAALLVRATTALLVWLAAAVLVLLQAVAVTTPVAPGGPAQSASSGPATSANSPQHAQQTNKGKSWNTHN